MSAGLRSAGAVFACFMASLAGFPWVCSGAILLLRAVRSVSELWPASSGGQTGRRAFRLALGVSLLLPSTALTLSEGQSVWEDYFAVLAWVIAGTLTPVMSSPGDALLRSRWRQLSMAWALCGGLIWLVSAYSQNRPATFYAGLGINAVLLILCRYWFRMGGFAIQAVNTIILLLIGIPATDLFVRAEKREAARFPSSPLLSYEASTLDPAAFADWWTRYLQEWNRMAKDLFVPDPRHIFPFRLRTNSQGFLFESRITINNLGLRGRPISTEKGPAYRIVALGESTTFGCTLRSGDTPWPELLEAMVADRLHPSRPVEVINAGVPAYNLTHNIHQLKETLLPLKPDLIISYHGYNGFKLLNKILDSDHETQPPVYQARPLRSLAAVEYRLRLIHYRQREQWEGLLHPPVFADPMETAYARAYGQLIELARTHRIRLVLANFSMAVNNHSAPDVVRFYRAGFPMVTEQIKANAVHSMLVRQIVRQHPGIVHADTHASLDGRHEHFIDLVHFTQSGRQRLAETLFPSVREILRKDGLIE